MRPEPDVQLRTGCGCRSVASTCSGVALTQNGTYTGVTSDWRARVEAHNAGRCLHTANGGPWEIDVVVQFTDEKRAVAFERYLKSGPGCAFAARHLR
jgi:hypothetical protein